MGRNELIDSGDDATTPILVSGVLAGSCGGLAGMSVTSLAALIAGHGPLYPAKLVAAALMGSDALDRANALPAAFLGTLVTLVAASAAGVLFAWLRRREWRFRVLVLEGVGFGLVVFAALRFTLPYLDPLMAARQPMIPLAIAYALFGAALSMELPLRIGSLRFDDAMARESLAE
jgi:hypothetical protein